MSDQPAPPPIHMLNVLQDLCLLLSRDPLTVAEVKHSLASLPLHATVEREPGSTAPAFVRFALPDSVRLTLDDLQSTFGPARQLPGLHRGAPLEYLISVDRLGAPYTCALLIEAYADAPFVEAVTVRRDIRLT